MFQIKGYFIDYYVNGKYKGLQLIKKPDREVFGYHGRKSELLSEDIKLTNNKVLKKGTSVVTMLNILNGRKLKKEELQDGGE